MPRSRQKVIVCILGPIAYQKAWDLQKKLQARLVEEKRAPNPQPIPHVCLMVEHPPVYTLGKSGNRSNLLVDGNTLESDGAEFFHIDRGGDITYHGPGQVVGYPILDLDRFYTDIHRYLRDLEEVIIRTCASYQIKSTRIDGRTGVWVEEDDQGSERKISAMGIRCSRWVTMHGFAFNVNTDLERYNAIVPCGISDRGVTSMQAELGIPITESDVHKTLLDHFQDVFDVDLEVVEGKEADGFLAAYLAEKALID